MPFSFLTAQIQVLMAAFYSTLYIIATIKVWFRDSYTDLKILPTVPGGHWLWGHEKEAWEAADGGFYSDNFEKYGRAIVMKGALFHSDILAISDPAAIAHVMQKDAFTYNKPAATRPLFGQRASDPLTWTEDQKHQHQRSILAPFFTNESVKAMSHTIHKTANKLVTTLRHHIIHDTDNDTSPYSYSFPKSTITINALDWTFAATLTVIGRVALGYDFQLGVNNPDAVAIHTAWRSIARFSTSFAAFVIPLVVRAFPFTFLVHLPASGTIQAHGEAKDVIHKRAKKIIAEKQQHPGDFEGEVGSPEKQGQDFLSTLMQQDSRHDEDSVKDILEHISTLITSGHETTAAAISHTLYALARDKPAQDTLRQELLDFEYMSSSLLMSETNEPSYEDFLKHLPVLDAVCKETLRVYPSITKSTRVAVLDDIIPLRFPITSPKTGKTITSIEVRAGQIIEINHMAINRSRSVWGPDAAEWKPERWLSSKGNRGSLPASSSVSHGWNGMTTFLEGPRMCIGMRLALFEHKVMVSELIKAFEFLPDAKVESLASVTNFTTPHVVGGSREDGMQLPLRVRCI